MSPTRSNSEFESWLEADLQRALRPVRGPSPLAAQAAYRRSRRRGRSLVITTGGVLAALTGKGAAAIVAAAMAVAGGGVVAAAAATGSANPATWAQAVVQAV